MTLPPCIKRMLSEFKPEYAPIIAGYFRAQRTPQKAVMQVLSAYDISIVAEVLRAYRDGAGAAFSCDFIQSHYPDFCDKSACPLVNNFDPVEMAKRLIDRVVYVADTGEMIIYFRGSNERMIFNYAKAMNSTRTFATEFLAKTIMVANVDIDLRPHRDPDTGERIDPAFDFLKWLGYSSEKVANEDAYGVGAVLQSILSENAILTGQEARDDPEARVVVKEHGGKRKLFVDAQYLRFRMRSILGSQATPQKVNSILATYGVGLTRIRVGGMRRYFYVFGDEVLQRLIGETVDSLLGVGDWDGLLAKIEGMDKKGVNQ